jgi:hypothetical protein
MKFRFLSPALRELSDAAEYYDGEASGLGYKFILETEATVHRIINYPLAWNVLFDDFRHCAFRSFPYSIIYKITEQHEIVIVSVFHQKRKPDSWRDLI